MGGEQAARSEETKVLCRNRRARHDYQIQETVEVGLVLRGSEVKSLRDGRVHLRDAYAEVRSRELWLLRANISEYPFAHQQNHPPERERKLLAHGREIRRLATKVEEKGFTLVPLELYLRRGRVKLLLGLAKGKRQIDKRAALKEREQARELEKEQARRR